MDALMTLFPKFLHRDAFPGQSAFIHRSYAFKDDSVNRNAGSGAYDHRISLIQLLHGDLNLFSAPFYGGRFRSQIWKSLLIASEVFPLDLASRYFPTVINVRIIDADSKYKSMWY